VQRVIPMYDLQLNLAALVTNTRLAGPGVRDLIWVQGCRIGCPGCANAAYQPHEPRVSMPVSRLLAHFRARRGRIDGCTISGGEPSEQAPAVASLLQGVQALGLSTVLYSGRSLRELDCSIAGMNLLRNTDLLIDGPYIADKPSTHPWIGSRNQRMHLLSTRFSASDLAEPKTNVELILRPGALTSIGKA
jgi:anaerobic ribonucleoside-triphosphate reductase activating protein